MKEELERRVERLEDLLEEALELIADVDVRMLYKLPNGDLTSIKESTVISEIDQEALE